MPRWGMVLDLDRCTGCGACVVACRAENNVPPSDPETSAARRSVSWLEILVTESAEDGGGRVRMLPRPCMQCDHPPCVKVCPVYATTRNEEGIVTQIYDRCIGCRYCTNNCPYTVKYFNWREPEWPEGMDACLNPDVTRRGKGVVEKCTFCHHRLQRVRDLARAQRRDLADGEYLPACCQTCPANAIEFGDLDDPGSAVARLAKTPRAFRLMEDLGTEPKVFYLSEER